jgi:hypothetical protein
MRFFYSSWYAGVVVVFFVLNSITSLRANFPSESKEFVSVVSLVVWGDVAVERVKKLNTALDRYGFVVGSAQIWNMFSWHSRSRWTYEVRSENPRGALVFTSQDGYANQSKLSQVTRRFRLDRYVHQAYNDAKGLQQFLMSFCEEVVPQTGLFLIQRWVEIPPLSVDQRQFGNWRERLWSTHHCS